MTQHKGLPYIQHMRDAVRNIELFTKGLSKERFLRSGLRQSAVVRQLEIIGEAAKNIPEDMRQEYPDIAWKKLTGTRDKLIHHYLGVDLEMVWNIIEEDIPSLKKKIEKILKEKRQL